jgi:nicotinamidase-related amidase
MAKCLFVIDVQQGFITKETEHILAKIDSLINLEIFDFIVATRFVNEENSPFRNFMSWNKVCTEEEARLYKPVSEAANLIVTKGIYSGLSEEVIDFVRVNKISKVFLVGIDTDCCVLATAISLFERNIRPFVLADYSASTGGMASHRAGIRVLERLIGRNSVIKGLVNKQLIEKF